MKLSSVEKKEKSTLQLAVEISAEEFEQGLNSAFKKNRGSVMIPGFRKGKAPRKIIEAMYGESIFYEDAINILYPDAFEYAVGEEKLKTVGQPSVDDVDVSDEKILTIKFLTAVYPEVTLGEYKELSAAYEEAPVTDEDVAGELETLRKRNARIVPAERPAGDGDTVVIDFDGYLDGEPFEGGKAEEHSLTLGSGSFVPGFEEQLAGMSAGEEKDVNITFPEDYAEGLAGKDVVFKVKLREVKEEILPELDDEFAKDVSEFDTLDEYRASVRERLTGERKNAADEAFKNALMDSAVQNMEADVPDAMVDQQIDQMVQDFYYNLSAQGMNPEEYLKMMGMTPESFRESCRVNAEKRVRTDLLLGKIAEVEKIELTDEDLDAQYKNLAESYGMEEEKVRAAVTPENISIDLKMKKAADIIYDSAKAEKPKKAAASKAVKKDEGGVKKRAKSAKKTEQKEKEESAE